jgi:hypothetical protein
MSAQIYSGTQMDSGLLYVTQQIIHLSSARGEMKEQKMGCRADQKLEGKGKNLDTTHMTHKIHMHTMTLLPSNRIQ